MAFNELLDHRCDIYHLKKDNKSVGYGLPDSVSFEYGEKPDLKDIICHFGVESLDFGMKQTNPQNILTARIKLTLPAGTDIRINDKVVNHENGMEYTAQLPVKVRKHHIFVYVEPTKEQETL